MEQRSEIERAIDEEDAEESRLLWEMSENGVLAEAGHRARAETFALGLPVTLSRGDEVIREYPDGRIEFVKKIGEHRTAAAS